MVNVDAKMLFKDAERLCAEHEATRSAHDRTGATAIIFAALPIIQKLRSQGCALAVIAAALAVQGAVQGRTRQPLTGRRLSALLSAIEKREERRTRKRASRRARFDLVPERAAKKLSISTDLTETPASPQPSAISETAIRTEAFANLQTLLKRT